uniref:Testis specific serine kinase substrate n=1 Tax=Saimiri boliviensis boliviensis TaxID=39432 RepID=A0A2K6UV85_SAIBB
MASVVVKTIWQSKEIHEAGDTPAGVESCSQLVPEAPRGVTSPGKGIPKKKKAVSFHSGVNSGLVRAKDSITSLKEKTTRVNQHVQTLQSKCSVLSENLERRRQEAEELEGYCIQLKENCWMVTRSVEDAEIKTNVLKQNSALLEEKLRYLQQHLQDETPRRQEAELQEPEQKQKLEQKQKPEAGLSRNCLGPAATPQGCPGPPGSPHEPSRPRSLAPGAWGMGPRAGEGPHVSEQELQKVFTGLEELRREVSSLTARWRQEEGAVQEALRLLGGLGGRVDGFLGQWERAQREQAQTARGLQELRGRADELCTMVERSAVSVASLRSELEGLGPLKPILEEFGRQFQNSRRGPDLSMNLDRSHQGNCARCASQGSQLSTESLQQLLDRALTPLVDEVKQRGLAPACPSCQRLHKKILELERQALAKHVRAEALSSTLRLAQDEAMRAKNLLLTDKMKPEEKMATLDYLHLKMCSLHDQLSNLPLEGSTGTMGGGSSAGTPPKHGGPAPEQ